MLAINGEKDLQVPPAQNLTAIEAALKEGGNTRYTIKQLPGLNHLFQTAKTGSPDEYATIEETMDQVRNNIQAGKLVQALEEQKALIFFWPGYLDEV